MRLGDVNYTEVSPGKWRYNWTENGIRNQQTVSGLSAKSARLNAHDLNEKLQRQKLGLGDCGQGAPKLEDGFDLAKSHSRARAPHQKNRSGDVRLFLSWLAGYAPDVKTWGDLRPSHIREYQKQLEASGKSYWRIKGRLEPISQAWHAVHANHPDSVLAPPRMDMRGLKVPRPKTACLTPAEVKVILDWLKAHAPSIYPIAALQSLAGLRMLEASSLRLCDVDEAQGTIRIDDTSVHQLKNEPSHRTIPIAPSLMAVLAPWIDAANKKGREYLFVATARKRGAEPKCMTTVIVKRWGRALRHLSAAPKEIKREVTGKRLTINPHGLARPELYRVPARKLRTSFSTMLIGKADRDIIRLYIGHSDSDVLARFYQVSSVDLLRPIADAVEKICNESTMSILDASAENKNK